MSKLEQIRNNAAGIDIGSEKIFIGMPDGTVKSYSTFTPAMRESVSYLKQQGVQSVAMESTGVCTGLYYLSCWKRQVLRCA
jgi:transposase